MSKTIETNRASAEPMTFDVIIVGGGIAGLSVALNLPQDTRIALLTKGALGESNTRYAQGGLAAAVGLDDEPELHLQDTLNAGAGLVDETATRVLVTEAREAVAWLIRMGTEFDEREQTKSPSHELAGDDLAERYDLAQEGAHSRRRVLHAQGDATGAEIERALVDSIRARPGMRVFEQTQALELIMSSGQCIGVEALQQRQRLRLSASQGVVLANGGAGRLWLRTSNPEGATADGIALAWRAGATLADLEFAQFHPTVLVPPDDSDASFLISEAVRGEGAYLRNAAGERFMPHYHPDAELAPRDVVARAILNEMLTEGVASAFLDLRHLPAQEIRERFPTIAATCRQYHLDLATDLIPVAPAAHYFMGGVAVDTWARTTIPHLYAVGEVACTGVHGANRLASNSLLEGLVFGRRLARLLSGTEPTAHEEAWPTRTLLRGEWVGVESNVTPEMATEMPPAKETRATLQHIMWEHVALRRDEAGLTVAIEMLRALSQRGPFDPETANMLLAAQLITEAALARHESRGGHYRTDYPERDSSRDGSHTLLRAAQMPTLSAMESEAQYAHA